MSENMDMVITEEIQNEMVSGASNVLSLEGANFCSLAMDSAEAKASLFNAMVSPDHRLSDYFNQAIKVVDVIVEVVPMLDKATGEYRDCPRVIFFDEEGATYQAVSFGVYNALKRLFMIYGKPHWDSPIPIVPKQITNKDRKITTLVIAAE